VKKLIILSMQAMGMLLIFDYPGREISIITIITKGADPYGL
jgi:hypothetical protein